MAAATGHMDKEDFDQFTRDLTTRAAAGEQRYHRPQSREELESLLNPGGPLDARTEVEDEG